MSVVPEIVIASFEKAESILRRPERDGVRHVVSIGEPGSPAPAEFRWLPMRKLRLEFDDITGTAGIRAGYQRASREQIAELIAFLTGVNGKILFHCAWGISRSAAAACIFAAMRLGPGRERAALDLVRLTKDNVKPNKHMLRLADELLERRGALLGAAFDVWHEGVDVLR